MNSDLLYSLRGQHILFHLTAELLKQRMNIVRIFPFKFIIDRIIPARHRADSTRTPRSTGSNNATFTGNFLVFTIDITSRQHLLQQMTLFFACTVQKIIVIFQTS